MNSWLSAQLNSIRIAPSNPMDTRSLALNAKEADRRIGALADIAFDLGWHHDASLETAWEYIGEYEKVNGQNGHGAPPIGGVTGKKK